MLFHMQGTAGLARRETYITFEELEAGEYTLFCEIDWVDGTKDKSFQITYNGKADAEFTVDAKFKAEDPRAEIMNSLMKGMIT